MFCLYRACGKKNSYEILILCFQWTVVYANIVPMIVTYLLRFAGNEARGVESF